MVLLDGLMVPSDGFMVPSDGLMVPLDGLVTTIGREKNATKIAGSRVFSQFEQQETAQLQASFSCFMISRPLRMESEKIAFF